MSGMLLCASKCNYQCGLELCWLVNVNGINGINGINGTARACVVELQTQEQKQEMLVKNRAHKLQVS